MLVRVSLTGVYKHHYAETVNATSASTRTAETRRSASVDPRAKKIRRQLHRAATELSSQDQSFNVTALTREAGVSRATFYAHYTDLAAFVLDLQKQQFISIAELFQTRQHLGSREAMLDAQRQLVHHFARQRPLYRLVFTHGTAPDIFEGTINALAKHIQEHIVRTPAFPQHLDPAMSAQYIAGAVTTLIVNWINSHSTDEETLALHLLELMPKWMYETSPESDPKTQRKE